MDNKLSELRKPVGFVSDRASTQLKEGYPASIRPFFDVQGSSPLYSQEYVSALLAELEASKQYAKERDAENESLALTVGRLRVELHNEGAANAHAYERIRELEKRLSTPVRLQSPWVDKVGNRWLLEGTTADAIRASGFAVTVEGDE